MRIAVRRSGKTAYPSCAGTAELHNVAAFIGGAAAHEVVKLTTRQYIPFNNTYVFNGMTGSATTIDL